MKDILPRSTEFKLASGVKVLVEPSAALPLVDVQIVLSIGNAQDPAGYEGQTWLWARMLRMGTGKVRRDTVDETLARMGAQLGIEVTSNYVRLSAVVLERNLEPLLHALTTLLFEPALRPKDLAQVKREGVAALQTRREHDRTLAWLHFRNFVYGDHPYGRVSTAKTLRRNQVEDLLRLQRRQLNGNNILVGFAGSISVTTARTLCERYFGKLPSGKPERVLTPAPKAAKGLCIRVIDKPDRTQTQMMLGGLGIKFGDALHLPLMVGNTALGGMTSSRLMQEIRAKRGWSYGASSSLGMDRQNDLWYAWTFPSLAETVPCLALLHELATTWVDSGIDRNELNFAKDYLIRSYAFDRDTAVKRLTLRIEQHLFPFPERFFERYPALIRAVTLRQTNEAIKARIKPQCFHAVVVASARDVVPDLEKLPGVRDLSVVSFETL